MELLCFIEKASKGKSSHFLKPLFFKPPTKSSFLNYQIFNVMPYHQLCLTQANASQRYPFREAPWRVPKPRFWKVSLEERYQVLPSPVTHQEQQLPSEAQQLLVTIWETGKFWSSQSSSHSIQLNWLFICDISADRRKGREVLPVDCHVYGIISERWRKMQGDPVPLH